jgi:hypothetical protein
MLKKSKSFTDSNIQKEFDSALKALEQKYNIEINVELEMDVNGIFPVVKYYQI